MSFGPTSSYRRAVPCTWLYKTSQNPWKSLIPSSERRFVCLAFTFDLSQVTCGRYACRFVTYLKCMTQGFSILSMGDGGWHVKVIYMLPLLLDATRPNLLDPCKCWTRLALGVKQPNVFWLYPQSWLVGKPSKKILNSLFKSGTTSWNQLAFGIPIQWMVNTMIFRGWWICLAFFAQPKLKEKWLILAIFSSSWYTWSSNFG